MTTIEGSLLFSFLIVKQFSVENFSAVKITPKWRFLGKPGVSISLIFATRCYATCKRGLCRHVHGVCLWSVTFVGLHSVKNE